MLKFTDLTERQHEIVLNFKSRAFNEGCFYFSELMKKAQQNNTVLDMDQAIVDTWMHSEKVFNSACNNNNWDIKYEDQKLIDYLFDIKRGQSKEHAAVEKKYKAKKQVAAMQADMNEIRSLVIKLRDLCEKQNIVVDIKLTEKESEIEEIESEAVEEA